jgi:glutaconyl-CoA/methylmalonyl-CoA decarboxylase subunit delta
MNIRVGRNRAGAKGGTKRSDRGEISGEETAAIALALYLYTEESHDRESGVLTIKRISRAYSPWSSKIYAVRNQFNRL